MTAVFEHETDLDLDGDSAMEIVLVVENQNAKPAGLIARNGATRDVLWIFQCPQENLEDLGRGFHGFFDVNGDGEKEALLGNHTAVTLDGTVHPLDPHFQILALTDVDNDGYADLVGRGVADSTVQVWSTEASTTGVTENDLVAAGFHLYQNYTNPFNPTTVISFQLAAAAEVDLTIYNYDG